MTRRKLAAVIIVGAFGCSFFVWLLFGRIMTVFDPPPGGIVLPAGYDHRTMQGIDTHVGRIWKPGGLEIHYDFGPWSEGKPSDPKWKDKYQWQRQESFNGRTMGIGLIKTGGQSNRLDVGFLNDHYFFFAKVNSEEGIEEVLAILRTFTPPEPPL